MNMRIIAQGEKVLFIVDGKILNTIHWRAASESLRELRAVLFGHFSSQEKMKDVLKVDIDGEKKTEFFMTGEAAWQFLHHLHNAVKQCEELDAIKNGTLIEDSAILLRAGAPIGLTDNPKALEEAKKMAAWDSRIRRYMGRVKGIASAEQVGKPVIRRKN